MSIQTTKLILNAVDPDISEHFSSMKEGSYMTALPLYIHIGRHLAKISSMLTESHKYSCNCPDTGCKSEDDIEPKNFFSK